MKKTLSFIMGILLLTSILTLAFNIESAECSEPPETEWERTYGGTSEDMACCISLTEDCGYAMVGATKSFGVGDADFWLIKTDSSGNIEWDQTYGGGSEDRAYSVVQTNDGGYAILGRTYSFGAGSMDFWLVKTDSVGNMEWNKTYGGTGWDKAWSVVQTIDGGYAILGETKSFGAGKQDLWMIKTDASGNIEWDLIYGGADLDAGHSLVQTGDMGYALAGVTQSFGAGGQDFWLIKTDSSGNIEWDQTYGGTDWDNAYSLVQTIDGGYAMVGFTYSFGAGSTDFWLVKTDSAGTMQWNRTYGGADADIAMSVVQTIDGGYAIVGETKSFGVGYKNFWLVKTDSAGNALWNKAYGGTNIEVAWSVVETCDGGCAIAGYTNSHGAGGYDFWLIKLAPLKISATVDVDPDTLNLKSNGEWATAYIELPDGYSVSDIDVPSIQMNTTIPVDTSAPTQIGDYDLDGVPDLMVKFDRASIIEWLGSIDHSEDTGKSCLVTFTITGKVLDRVFEGSNAIKVLRK